MLKKLPYILFFFLSACIDPVEFKFGRDTEHLVVEARFTNDNLEKRNYVRLMKSIPYSTPYNNFVGDADVEIVSLEGESFRFIHETNGFYYPENLFAKGIVGHTYTLKVTLPQENKIYASDPITLGSPAPVAIENVYYEYEEEEVYIKGIPEVTTRPGYRVYVDFNDPSEAKNFYRWSYQSTYEVHTQPEDHVERVGQAMVPAPKDCCATCWIQETDREIFIYNDRLSNGQNIKKHKLFFIPFEKKLNVKYKLNLFQHSLSERSYNFYKSLMNQSETEGSIFDPPPSEIKGNMYNTINPDEQVIGFFDVSAVSRFDLTINAEDIPYAIPAFVYPDDCREMIYDKASTNIPEGWE